MTLYQYELMKTHKIIVNASAVHVAKYLKYMSKEY